MMNRNNILTSMVITLALSAIVSAQTVPHWIDRQTHGLARHLTPRHHKPGQPYTYRYDSVYTMNRGHRWHYRYYHNGHWWYR